MTMVCLDFVPRILVKVLVTTLVILMDNFGIFRKRIMDDSSLQNGISKDFWKKVYSTFQGILISK